MASQSTNSSSILLDDVDDYLAPSQACINPLFLPSSGANKEQEDSNSLSKPLSQVDGPPLSHSAVVIPRRKRRSQALAAVGGVLPKVPAAPQQRTSEGEPKKQEDSVKASIADCLACSGCVTTAETVLLEQEHSLTALRTKIVKGDRLRALTISPSSWADLFRHLGFVEEIETDTLLFVKRQRQVTTLLHKLLKVDLVIDGNLPLQWSLLESAREFCDLYRQRQQQDEQNQKRQRLPTPPPSTAIDSKNTLVYGPNGNNTIENITSALNSQLPLISGSCPALVCLVEKSRHALVAHLAATKSPMSLMGAALGADVYDHWAIMPCHDKKLEASRKDYLQDATSPQNKDVDLVVTTHECFQLIREWLNEQQDPPRDEDNDLAKYISTLPLAEVVYNHLPETEIDGTAPILATVGVFNSQQQDSQEHLPSTTSTSAITPNPFVSGGYADFIFRFAALNLFGYKIQGSVPWHPVAATSSSGEVRIVRSARVAALRSKDYYQAGLYKDGDMYTMTSSATSKPVLKFAIANGMQTLQRVLTGLEQQQQQFQENGNGISNSTVAPSAPLFDYVEAMACPSGCVNGGGQIRLADRETPTQTRQRVAATQSLFHRPVPPINGNEKIILPPALGNDDKAVSRTKYHVVPPMAHSMGVAKGVAVTDILW
jgi:iron only hydrogenase large subunit-like protein